MVEGKQLVKIIGGMLKNKVAGEESTKLRQPVLAQNTSIMSATPNKTIGIGVMSPIKNDASNVSLDNIMKVLQDFKKETEEQNQQYKKTIESQYQYQLRQGQIIEKMKIE